MHARYNRGLNTSDMDEVDPRNNVVLRDRGLYREYNIRFEDIALSMENQVERT